MGQVERDLEERTELQRIAQRTGKLLLGGARRSGQGPRELAMDDWLRAMTALPRTRQVELSFACETGASIRLLGGSRSRELSLDLDRLSRRAPALGLERVLWNGGAAEHELFQSASLLMSISSLAATSPCARDFVPCLAGCQFQDVHFALRLDREVEQEQAPLLSEERKLEQLLRDAAGVLIHDIRSLPDRSPEREALLQTLLALLSRIVPGSGAVDDELFHQTLKELRLRQGEWRELLGGLDPRAPKNFLWDLLDQMPENPSPELSSALFTRVPELLDALLEHASTVRRSGVPRILQLLLQENPQAFEQALESGSPQQASGALLVYEHGRAEAPVESLRRLALRFGPIELRSQALRMLQRVDPGGSWAVELLDDPVRELRRLSLHQLSGRQDRLSEMIASYQSSPTRLDAEERRLRLGAIAACDDPAAQAFVQEQLKALPETDKLSRDELRRK
ncbi:MAG: hypothetical protein CSA62_11135 [Planctomycetota bacterium]|nr:MAG: hypothetical protein CSA62_11135 [Planctomycetota bacterium]